MNAKKIWTTLALSGLAVLATASLGSSQQGKAPQSDVRSTRGEAGTALCFGDGTGAKCGALVPGDAGRGCQNSVGNGGGLLMGHGSARLSQDNLVLEAFDLPARTTVLFMQSARVANQGSGYTFGDGVMCLDGPVHLIAVRQPKRGGIATYPRFNELPISIDTKVNKLQPTQYYQVMYRDPGMLGREDHFNLTNALEVVWGL